MLVEEFELVACVVVALLLEPPVLAPLLELGATHIPPETVAVPDGALAFVDVALLIAVALGATVVAV